MNVYTVGHGTRPAEELLAMLEQAGVETLVDVRRRLSGEPGEWSSSPRGA